MSPSDRCFLEVQLPVSRLSKESYRERKAVAGQTLTALGKWWGRKPLVLVRALLLGLLLPATDDPEGDRATFLALMTMDDEGLYRRLDGPLPPATAYAYATERERERAFETVAGKPRWRRQLGRGEREQIQRVAFNRMGYDARLEHCVRPEEADGPSPEAWVRVNAHLSTDASSLAELVQELGERNYGHRPRVGDAFAGGGSIPFEAARIGCDAFGNDLSPVAALLTWGALEIVGGGQLAVTRVAEAQRRVFDRVARQVDEWGIERNERGWIADAYLYCVEARDPISGWAVPLAPGWVVASKPAEAVVARLRPVTAERRFDIEIVEHASGAEVEAAKIQGTWRGGLVCPVDADGQGIVPERRIPVSFDQLRGRDGLRCWTNEDVVPRRDDVLQERLYCVRWFDPETGKRHYLAPTVADAERETRVAELLSERLAEWQAQGCIPSREIEPGNETERLQRERGWTRWHHLFNPRQLLLNGLFAQESAREDGFDGRASLLMVGRLANWNSRLARWQTDQGGGIGGGKETLYNQAFNTLMNYSCRAMATLESVFLAPIKSAPITGTGTVSLADARAMDWSADIWVTDPGYADAIDYEELSEHFLAWYEKRLPVLFPGWYTDSKRALAVAGKGLDFRRAMIDCYRRMASLMPDDGLQVVMFTHQNAEVWADLALILWAAGLRVTAAWTVQTETEAAGIKQGNYVQGTVLLVLRKRVSGAIGDLAEIFPRVQTEVCRQVEEMQAIDDRDQPNFDDADYQLAAYAAAMRVVTAYERIEDIDVDRELYRERAHGTSSPLTQLIERAVRVASDYLVPRGLTPESWRRLAPEERFYVRGLAAEAAGDRREGTYQEFARGLGVMDYRPMLASDEANAIRLRTPAEFGSRDLGGGGFGGTLLRRVLFAIHVTSRSHNDPREGILYLRHELADYWERRAHIVALLSYVARTPSRDDAHWASDLTAADLLLGAVENDRM